LCVEDGKAESVIFTVGPEALSLTGDSHAHGHSDLIDAMTRVLLQEPLLETRMLCAIVLTATLYCSCHCSDRG